MEPDPGRDLPDQPSGRSSEGQVALDERVERDPLPVAAIVLPLPRLWWPNDGPGGGSFRTGWFVSYQMAVLQPVDPEELNVQAGPASRPGTCPFEGAR